MLYHTAFIPEIASRFRHILPLGADSGLSKGRGLHGNRIFAYTGRLDFFHLHGFRVNLLGFVTYVFSLRYNRFLPFCPRIAAFTSGLSIPGTCRRFRETIELYFQAIQSIAPTTPFLTLSHTWPSGVADTVTSGCKLELSWVLIEYTYHLNIPDDIVNHPVIRSPSEATVAWSNVSPRRLTTSDSILLAHSHHRSLPCALAHE